jgi:hypothetical protein
LKVEQSQVMICTPETYRSAPDVSGLAIITLSHESRVEEIWEGLDTNILGFDPQAQRATLQEAEEFRQGLMLSRAFRQGAILVFLIAANEQAGRIYEHVGFRPHATRVVYEVSVSSEED